MPTNVSALAFAAYSASGVRPKRPSRLPPFIPRSPLGQNLAQRTARSTSSGPVDHADHHAAGPRFQRPHDRRVIGRREAHEAVQAVGSRGQRRQLDVLHADAGMLRVEPEAVELAVLPDDLDELRAQQLAGAEDSDDLAVGQQWLDLPHSCSPSHRTHGSPRPSAAR